MWDVIKMSDINPMYSMTIFIASGLLRKKKFEKLFTLKS